MFVEHIDPLPDPLNQNRNASSFPYQQQVRQNLDAMLAWCRNECRCDWRWQLVENSGFQAPGVYRFYFDSDRDACAFALKWS